MTRSRAFTRARAQPIDFYAAAGRHAIRNPAMFYSSDDAKENQRMLSRDAMPRRAPGRHARMRRDFWGRLVPDQINR